MTLRHERVSCQRSWASAKGESLGAMRTSRAARGWPRPATWKDTSARAARTADPAARALNHVLEDWADESVYAYLIYYRWAVDENAARVFGW